MEKVYFGSPVFVYLLLWRSEPQDDSVAVYKATDDRPNYCLFDILTRPRLSFSGLFDGRRSIRGDRESLLGSFNQIMKFITYIADDIPSHYQISYLIWKRATETPHKRPRRRGDQ